MSKQALTPKREKFAQHVAAGMSHADAYRESFKAAGKDKTIHEAASRIANDGKVKARIEELRKPVVAAVRYGLREAMREADEAIALAKKMDSASALVAAIQLKAKLNGLLVEDRTNRRRPYEDMGEDQLDRAIEEKAREAGMSVH